MTDSEFIQRRLGSTGLTAGRLGMAASYGAPAPVFEDAFEKGCNYFYMGGGRKKSGMKKAVKNLCGKGKRDELILSLQTFARIGFMTETLFSRALKSMGTDYADVLVLGWHNRQPFSRLIDFAVRLREKGLCRHIAMSGHQRTLFPKMADIKRDGRQVFDLFHIRYNAAHRGAETECFPDLKVRPSPLGIVSYTATRWGQLMDPSKMPEKTKPLRPRDCYRFALSNPHVDITLCGPKNRAQMQEALKALDEGPVDSDEKDRFSQIGDHVRARSSSIFS